MKKSLLYNGVRDPTDYVINIDSNNVFIKTNMIQAIQSRGKCPEDPQFNFTRCDPNNKHVKEECLRYLNKSDNIEGRGINGIPTGNDHICMFLKIYKFSSYNVILILQKIGAK